MREKTKQLLKFLRLNWPVLSALLLGFFVVFFLAGILFSKTYLEDKSPPPTPLVVPLKLKVVKELPSQVDLAKDDVDPEHYVPDALPVKYIVQKGDSAWRLAEAFYGCGLNYVDIERVNGVEGRGLLEIGQELIIPRAWVRCEVVKTELVDKPEVDQPVVDESPPTDDFYQVQPGDCLWTIAFNQLGNPYRWTEIYELNRSVIGSNPNLIYPQTQLLLPAR